MNLHLSCDGDLVVVLVAQGALLLVPVVERDGHGRLRDAGLSVLVDQLLFSQDCSHRRQQQSLSDMTTRLLTHFPILKEIYIKDMML
jgi:hypothetical protein